MGYATRLTVSESAKPRETLVTVSFTNTPTYTTPIRQIVMMVKENRTYDNLFGSFPGANGQDRVGPRQRHISDRA